MSATDQLINILTSFAGGGSAAALLNFLKWWWDKRQFAKEEKYKVKLAEKAMKFDKADAAEIYKTFLGSKKKDQKKE